MVSSDSFAQAREKKRLLFQKAWDRFIAGPLFLLSAVILTAASFLFFLFSGGFIRQQAIALNILAEDHHMWCYGVIAAAQLLCAAPSLALCAGLWLLRKSCRWQDHTAPDISGLRLMRRTNFLLCCLTGITLALYPTIIITAGEYLLPEALYRLFYLLLFSCLLFILCVTLVRAVLRSAEENITCCWANTRFLLPLWLILLGGALAIFLFAPLKQLFYPAAGLLCIAFFLLCFSYWLFLKKLDRQFAPIDREAIASREDPNDPYLRY